MNSNYTTSEFVADAVIARMRTGHLPTAMQAQFLDRLPLIDLLRQQIRREDTSWLLPIISTQDDYTAGLCCSLLRRIDSHNEVRDSFVARWDTARPYLKNRLMWRLLDDPDLSSDWQQKFFEFVLAEWDTFSDFNHKFYPPGDSAVTAILSRIGNPSFPESKKWIYLCCLSTLVEDRDTIKALLQLGNSFNDAFAKSVTEELLRRCNQKNQDSSTIHESFKEYEGLDFIADATISKMREGQSPTEQEAASLNRLPLIDLLRNRVTDLDLTWIFNLLEKETDEVAGLYLSLLRKFTERSEIQAKLRKKWENSSSFLRAHLLWRILDDPDLPTQWHEILFKFALEEWEIFTRVSVKFLGGPDKAVIQSLKRLGDPTFPNSKKWAYLCRVPEVANDQEAALALIRVGRLIEDPFTRYVAETLLDRFYRETPILQP